MKWILVNGREVKSEGLTVFCAYCAEKITAVSYTRDLQLRIIYCSPRCWGAHVDATQLAIEYHAREVN